MPAPPLPASPCVRVRLDYNIGGAGEGGNRLYFSYSGSPPSPANCTTLAGDIASAWGTYIAPLVGAEYYLEEVDVLDIATNSGASGQWTGTTEGTSSGSVLPANVATNIEFGIARRYRGGKPRIYLPPPGESALSNQNTWTSAFLTLAHTNFAAFIAAIEALSIGSMGTLAHVNLSYYNGVNTSTPPWRGPGFKYPPKYRTTALLDTVESYIVKSIVGSQRRRRTATTP